MGGVERLNQLKALVVATGELGQLRKKRVGLAKGLNANLKLALSTKRALSYLEKSLEANRPPGLIVVGLNNPGEITGLEFAEQVRSYDSLSLVPIIILTAFPKSLSSNSRAGLIRQDITVMERESFYCFIQSQGRLQA